MKLQVTQENLNKALSSVAKVAGGRATLPILSNLLLKTEKNRLHISGTNLDIAISHQIGAKIQKEGAITIPARLTQDFISNLPAGVIGLEQEDNKLHINAEKYQSTINGTPPDDFPVMPAIKDGATLKLPATTIKQGLAQVALAASSDEARPVLTGVYLHSHQGNLYAVATDSYRLAEKKLDKTNQQLSLLVPASAINELLRVIDNNTETIELTYDEQQARFRADDTEIVTRLIDGNYPDYRKLIPSKFENTATLSKQDFVNITKVSSLFARESAGSVNIQLEGNKQEVSIKAVASQLGENTATASAKVKGQDTITLNSRYIIDALQALEGDEVTLSFNGKVEPSTLTSPSHKDYLHVIMPLKS